MRTAPALALAGALLPGCFTPPAVLRAGTRDLPLARFPAGTERIEVPVAEGAALRGVFVPADPGAPVVVHFLGGGDSVTHGTRGLGGHHFLRGLRDLGLASLCVDYRGVGPSDGDRDPRHLAPDAAAAFAEAARRAGGPDRVVVRAISLGTLAAGSLLDGDAPPAAAILVAPVRAETVAVNYAYHHWPDPLVWIAAPLFGPAGDVRLDAALAGARTRVLIAAPESDVFLPPAEMALLRAAATRGGAVWVDHRGLDHYDLAAEWMHVTTEEEAFLASVFPGLPPAADRSAAARAALDPADAERLDADPAAARRLHALCARHLVEPPRVAAALALVGAGEDPTRDARLLRWLAEIPPRRLDGLPFEALLALVDLDDPAGALDARELAGLARTGWGAEILGGTGPVPERAAAAARDRGLEHATVYEGVDTRSRETFTILSGLTRVGRSDGRLPAEAPARLALTGADARRQALRLALKVAGVPDRRAREGANPDAIEVFDAGRWRVLDDAPPDRATSAGAAAPSTR